MSGEIFFDEGAPPFSGAVVHVRLDDVSRADAPAIEVARLDIPDVSYQPGDPPLEFSLPTPSLDPAARYEIRAHADLDGAGHVTRGDQITMESYPVLTGGSPNRIRLRLRRIG